MSDDSESVQGTPSPSPPPCAKGCGFFGSPSTMNMCSKCFRDHQRTNPAAPEPASAPAAAAAPAPPAVTLTAAAFSPPVVHPAPRSPAPAAPAPVLPAPSAKPAPAAVVAAAPAENDPTAPPPRKVQKNTSRCFSCRKKIGLTGFKCHCGYFFCSEHRYSDKHDCDFDYQASAREQLEKANPVVVASKLEKI